MKIDVRIGNIFESKSHTLVNTVNCVGVMGKGVALEFKKRWPAMACDYENRCASKKVKIGEPYLYEDMLGTSIINFPTKQHWRAASRLADIEKGLDYFLQHYKEWGIQSIAFPPLGCGNGGLDWELVGPLMYSKLSALDIPIEIYAPFGTSREQLTEDFLSPLQHPLNLGKEVKGRREGKLNLEWLVILEVLYQLETRPYTPQVGRTIFQKICHALTALGLETGLDFKKSSYGPFSDQIQKMLNALANRNLILEEQLGKMNLLKIGPGFCDVREKNKDLLEKNAKKIDKSVDLFSRIKNTEQAEEVSTVFYAVSKLKEEMNASVVPEKQVYDFVLDWKKTWDTEDKRQAMASAIRNLAMLGWIRVSASADLPLDEACI